MATIRLALAQIDLTVGDLAGNAERIAEAYDDAVAAGADLVAFPELAVTGYPPEDLLLKPTFVAGAQATLDRLAARTGATVAVIGFPEPNPDGRPFNAAAVCRDGRVVGVYRKHRLPNYAVFDEARYFTPGSDLGPIVDVAGVPVAVSVCEDVWSADGPPTQQAAAGARLVVNVNASPYHARRQREREAMLTERAGQAGVPIAYVNAVGGQDELVFDGGSMVVVPNGGVVARAAQMRPDLLVVDLDVDAGDAPGARVEPLLDDDAEMYEALVVGTRDYVCKNGFTDALIGLSGGIDSSLVAAIAADALGPDHVTGVMMPSRYSSEGSVTDSEALVANLGIRSLTIPIEPAHQAFLQMLEAPFAGSDPGIAEENTQARIRGTLLMALSNKFGWIVLTTGNKSEMAVGYATLYGDMAGGYAVIKDVLKTRVYRLSQWRNEQEGREVIPRSVIEKPPSAELRPDQRDSDSLPPYEVLDPILQAYVEGNRSTNEIVQAGFDRETVRSVIRMVDRNEYKRRQAPPGVRVTPLAFGKDRRLPITNRWSA
ncbi:MAG TPA: NAD+ synthase [Acidimicrobiia bacterium]|nr:NAD+ synthase [Acidimicrobiia bacterium]